MTVVIPVFTTYYSFLYAIDQRTGAAFVYDWSHLQDSVDLLQ